MKNIFLTAILLAFLFVSPLARAETHYLTSLPDVPLMQGMQEITDSGVVFDKAEGRIVEESVKTAHLTENQVNSFYNETLPALGWRQESPQRFHRNGEQLIVNVDKLRSEGLVRFAVSPSQP